MSVPSLLRAFAANGLLLLATLALLLPLAEITLRVTRPQALPSQQLIRGWVLPGMYVADTDAGYRLAPNFSGRIERKGVVTEFRTNSLGLRAPELAPPRQGRPRIVAFGDSVTWGWGVPQGEEWISVVQRELHARAALGSVEGVNCGVPGYGTANELALLRQLGPGLRPDLVLVGFFPNDYTDNLAGTEAFTVKDGLLFDERSAEYLRESFLARESHLYRLVAAARGAARQRWLGVPPALPARRPFSTQEIRSAPALASELLLRMRDVSATLGARFAVVWLPGADLAQAAGTPNSPLQRLLQHRIEEAGVASLDLLRSVRAQPDVAGLYLQDGGHYSARGNSVVGRAVADWILEQGLLLGVSAQTGRR